jgi:hypothetical protein
MKPKSLRYGLIAFACIAHALFVDMLAFTNTSSINVSEHVYITLLFIWPVWSIVLWWGAGKRIWAAAIPFIIGLVLLLPCYLAMAIALSGQSPGG